VTAQDWFGVGLRLSAFWPLLLSFQNLLDFIVMQAGWSYVPLTSSETSPESYLLYAFGHGVFGLMLLWNTRKSRISHIHAPVMMPLNRSPSRVKPCVLYCEWTDQLSNVRHLTSKARMSVCFRQLLQIAS
jgi:hypothetical protein